MTIRFTSKDVLIQFRWDCLNMSVYNLDEEVRILFEKIAYFGRNVLAKVRMGGLEIVDVPII